MTLAKGNSRRAVASNIKTELAAGKPQPQAVAIALHEAHGSKKRPGPKRRPGAIRGGL